MRTALPSYSSDPFAGDAPVEAPERRPRLRDSSAALFSRAAIAQAAELAQPLDLADPADLEGANPGAKRGSDLKRPDALSRAAGAAVDAASGVAGTIAERASDLAQPISSGQRLVALDAARIFATFGVMWTHVLEVQGHSSSLTALGRFGTSFYIIAAVFLATRGAVRHPDRSWFEGAMQRGKRLFVPFLLWSALYATFYTVRLLPAHAPLDWNKLSVWWGPFAGCARHLWFLPFAFFASGVASMIAPRMKDWSSRRVLLTILIASTAIYWLCYRVLFFALDRYWLIEWHLHRLDRWIDEVPLVVLAMGAAILLARRDSKATPSSASGLLQLRTRARRIVGMFRLHVTIAHADSVRRRLLAPLGRLLAPLDRLLAPLGRVLAPHRQAKLVRGAGRAWKGFRSLARKQGAAPWLLVGFVAAQLVYMRSYEAIHAATHTEGRFMANLAGLCLLGAFLLARPRKWMAMLAPLGRYTYFAFLVHVMVIDYGFWRLSGLPGFGTVLFGLLSTIALFLICVQLGAVVRKIPALRWLTP